MSPAGVGVEGGGESKEVPSCDGQPGIVERARHHLNASSSLL